MLPKTADVVVIGGGVLGTSAAFHLADAGVRNVVLLDRGPIAGGTTPFAAGQTGYVNRDRFALRFGVYCIEFFEQFRERTGHAIDFRQPGSIRIALTDRFRADLEARRAAALEVGHEAEFLSPREARKRVPLLELPDDCALIYMHREGWVEPRSVAAAYAAGARDRGVTIRTRLAATDVGVAGGRVSAVETSEGRIETPWVVLAAGAWTRQFGRKLGLNLRTVPVRHQAFVTAPLAGVVMEQPIVRVTEPQVYASPEGGGLLVGGYGYRPLSFEMDTLPERFEIPALEADPVYYAQLTEAARRFFPALSEAVVVQERRGLPTIAPDGRLLVGESGQVKGLVVASSCMVGGIQHSPGAGRLVADIVTGRPAWIPPEALSVERFGEEYGADPALRARCEEVYGHHYHATY